VDYGSSEEEIDPSPRKATVGPAVNVVTGDLKPAPNESDETAASGNEEVVRDITEDKPMVGPAMPEKLNNNDDFDQDGSSGSPQHMSEHETIHYLTQATHPMASIPPSPPGSPNPTLNAKFKRFLELKAKGVHFNEDLANKSAFRNPGLLATMMTRAGLEGNDQYRTSLPTDTFDPTAFPPSAYKEELLRNQLLLKEKEQATKKSLSAAGKRTIDFTSGGTSAASSRESTPGKPVKRKRP
jgi:hypothetical protein